jgi:hypothetical protein
MSTLLRNRDASQRRPPGRDIRDVCPLGDVGSADHTSSAWPGRRMRRAGAADTQEVDDHASSAKFDAPVSVAQLIIAAAQQLQPQLDLYR